MIKVLILLIIIFLIWEYFHYDIEYIVSSIDKNTYKIRSGKKPKQYLIDSADTLAEINIRIEKLINHLLTHFQNDIFKSHILTKLRTNYNHNMISEASKDPLFTTYTIDKKDIHVCLRTRDTKEYLYDIDLLMYVVLHELAHLCNYDQNGNPIIGHGDEFKWIFRFLVQEAINIKVYNYTNYTLTPKEYCGITLSSNII